MPLELTIVLSLILSALLVLVGYYMGARDMAKEILTQLDEIEK